MRYVLSTICLHINNKAPGAYSFKMFFSKMKDVSRSCIKVTYAVNVVVDGVVVTADYHPIATIQVTLGDFQGHSPIACLYDVFFLPRDAMLASAVYVVVLCPPVSWSVCRSVTNRHCTKTAKRRITQSTPHDSTGTLVFRCQGYLRNSDGHRPQRKRQMEVE